MSPRYVLRRSVLAVLPLRRCKGFTIKVCWLRVQQEPTVLPARVPHLLVNGAAGIAVGIATNIPPHNLQEVVSGLCALIRNPDITVKQLMQHIPAPDFPTGEMMIQSCIVGDGLLTTPSRPAWRSQVAK